MEKELKLRIVVVSPLAGVDFGLQKGGGSVYETIQKQRYNGDNLVFEFMVKIKEGNNEPPVFLGPYVHGTPVDRFVYIDIGTAAGQRDSPWSRRLKIPLKSITVAMVQQSLSDPRVVIETRVPGIGKDGGPNCGTVKPFSGWKLASFQ